jgi:hypothetical protein
MRLLPYHPELNTVKIIWAAVESSVVEKSVTFNMDDVLKLVDKYMCSQICFKKKIGNTYVIMYGLLGISNE